MSDRLRVYVSGPMTHFDVAVNVRVAILAGVEILKAGHLPFVPHLYHFAHFLSPQPYETWLAFDLQWIEACHCVLRLPGMSPGADREVGRAKQLGLPVYFSLPECLQALPLIQEGSHERIL